MSPPRWLCRSLATAPGAGAVLLGRWGLDQAIAPVQVAGALLVVATVV